MTDEKTGLVIRRTTSGDGNKIAVRLSSSVDRTKDLYEMFRSGFIIEVLDSETSETTNITTVTLRFNAPREFQIDRMEKLSKPRTPEEIGGEDVVVVKRKSRDELKALSADELEDYLTTLREAEASLRAQMIRLKKDKSVASERGYRHDNNDHHDQWILITEEINIVTEQLDFVQKAIQTANAIKKLRNQELQKLRRQSFQDNFVRLTRETLSEEAFEKLRCEAESLAEQQIEKEEPSA